MVRLLVEMSILISGYTSDFKEKDAAATYRGRASRVTACSYERNNHARPGRNRRRRPGR
jgi:hypothetical protein